MLFFQLFANMRVSQILRVFFHCQHAQIRALICHFTRELQAVAMAVSITTSAEVQRG